MPKDLYTSENTTLYRIGDFAKYLGVTPDFLKHYEALGIIHSIQGENGYRYYRFQESIRLFESLKLKNLGFTIRESETIFNEMSEPEVMKACTDNIEKIRREISFKQTLVESFDSFAAEMSYTESSVSDWGVSNTEEMLFLPHTKFRNFIDDPQIYAVLPQWMNCLPVVRSAALIPPDRPDNYSLPSSTVSGIWGFTVSSRLAKRLELPLNSSVVTIPACKALHCKFSARIAPSDDRPVNYYTVWEKLDELGLKPAGSILAINNIGAHTEGKLSVNQHFIVPIEKR